MADRLAEVNKRKMGARFHLRLQPITICTLYLQNSCPKCFRSPLLEGRSVHGRGLRDNTPFPEPSAPPCPGSLHTLLPLVCNLGGLPVPWTHTEFTVILAPAEQSFW